MQKISGEEVTTSKVGIVPHSSHNQELVQKEKEIEDLQKMISSQQTSASQGEREYYAREPITFKDKRKVMGGNSDLAGDPYMMGHIASAGFDFAFDDIETIANRDATVAEKMMAGLFLGVKPAKLVGKDSNNQAPKPHNRRRFIMGYDPLINSLINVSKEKELIIEWANGLKIIGSLDTIFETNNGLDEDDTNYVEYDAAVIKVEQVLSRPKSLSESSVYNWLKKGNGSFVEISLNDDPPSEVCLIDGSILWKNERLRKK